MALGVCALPLFCRRLLVSFLSLLFALSLGLSKSSLLVLVSTCLALCCLVLVLVLSHGPSHSQSLKLTLSLRLSRRNSLSPCSLAFIREPLVLVFSPESQSRVFGL